nr:uncharacterized protein LOC128684120 [Cherax quadricarinatus]
MAGTWKAWTLNSIKAKGMLYGSNPSEEKSKGIALSCSASRSDASASLGRNERDHRMREKENSEISAMQKRLNKTSTRVSAINEGSRHGHEKGAVKKQPQALWEEGSSTIDPRVSEVLAMQEELKQKKNALEALMKRMGKSSSLNMDNISDNISDNVSETSDRLDGGNGTAATWGTTGLHDYSDNHYQHSRYDSYSVYICYISSPNLIMV